MNRRNSEPGLIKLTKSFNYIFCLLEHLFLDCVLFFFPWTAANSVTMPQPDVIGKDQVKAC